MHAWLFFGTHVSSIVLNDLEEGSFYLVATKILLCADLLCSYPLVFAAGREIVEHSLFERNETYHVMPLKVESTFPIFVEPKRRLLRLSLVLVTVCVAQLDFAAILSLVGGVAQVILAFVLPPLMALQLLRSTMSSFRCAANILLLVNGVAVATFSLLASLSA
mmetsp:Transcript_9709/g.23389  ORF Transcript_9709/g.23389 Transcript_9709/m.23389 type:complete len:163 (+) Transcript_9709:850-1338(+)